jgi:acetylornithine deacetylase/succinyl-diaminopimelate desuccinylase family protein
MVSTSFLGTEPVIQLLADLVRIPSMNPMGRNRSGEEYAEETLALFVADYLRRRGVPAELQEVSPRRLNVVAHVDAGAERSVLLEAHLDTVQADAMSVPPFDAKIVNGRLQGRGACDTKGSLAVFMDALCSLVAEGARLRYNVLLAAVADEEYQFTGARAAVAGGLRADFGICGEPTCLHVIRAHKGVTRWRLRTTGRAAHSEYPERGKNAIHSMGHVLIALERHAHELAQRPPHPLLGTPTMSVGVIEGGQAVNIVPHNCWIEIDRRTLPGERREDILGAVRAALEDVGDWSMDTPHLEAIGMEVPISGEDITRLRTAIERSVGSAVVESAQYATDAGIYCAAGIPCVVFGPGDIADAHTDAESIDLQEVLAAQEIIRRFLT